MKQLSAEIIDWLVNQSTLKERIGKSLAIRSAAFNNNFPWKLITRSQACSIYKQNGVK